MREYILFPDKLNTKETIHNYFQEMMELPEYYGRNFDALYDELTAITEETIFVIVCAEQEPSGSVKAMLQVMQDAAKENKNISIKYMS